MITAQFTQRRTTVELRLGGHAGAVAAGHDIVCSAASILAYTTAQALLLLWDENRLQKEPKVILRPGDAQIVAYLDGVSDADVLYTFWMAQVGYALLAKKYPEFVKVGSTT